LLGWKVRFIAHALKNKSKRKSRPESGGLDGASVMRIITKSQSPDAFFLNASRLLWLLRRKLQSVHPPCRG